MPETTESHFRVEFRVERPKRRFRQNGTCVCGNALRGNGQKECRTCHAAYMRRLRAKQRVERRDAV